MQYIKQESQFIALAVCALLTGFFAALFLILINSQQQNWLAISACGLAFFVFLIATINTLFEKAEF
jgi:hypothetical protein